MPTDTFFRLPEEKRARIMDSAWSEFTAVPYAEASINRIVQTSRIPRGSFYQYFEDKNDLFLTLIDEIRDRFLDLFHDTLERSGGDPFSMPCVARRHGRPERLHHAGYVFPAPSRCWSLNVNMDVQQLFLSARRGSARRSSSSTSTPRSCVRRRTALWTTYSHCSWARSPAPSPAR